MTTASDLLRRLFATLVADPAAWRGLSADALASELAYAASLGHPARLSGREAVERHVGWFRGAVEDFRFFGLRVYPCADPNGAVAEVKAEGRMRATGRTYRRDEVAHERIYWDQASVLVQVGLLDRSLPVRGREIAAQVLNPTQQMNGLIRRAWGKNEDPAARRCPSPPRRPSSPGPLRRATGESNGPAPRNRPGRRAASGEASRSGASSAGGCATGGSFRLHGVPGPFACKGWCSGPVSTPVSKGGWRVGPDSVRGHG